MTATMMQASREEKAGVHEGDPESGPSGHVPLPEEVVYVHRRAFVDSRKQMFTTAFKACDDDDSIPKAGEGAV